MWQLGVWDTGFFDNDVALDLCGTLETRGMRRLRQVLREVVSEPASDPIDEDLACEAIAAAAIIGHACGLKVKGVPDETVELLEERNIKCTLSDLRLAQEALNRVLDHSWLAGAWSPAHGKKWRKQVGQLLSGLEKLQSAASEPRARSRSLQNRGKRVKKAPKVKIEAGDIVLIPIALDEWVVTKVLFVSKSWRGAVVLGVTNQTTRSLTMPSSVPTEYIAQIWAMEDVTDDGLWHKVGNIPLLEHEKEASLCRIADEVWLEDTCLRKATAKDEAEIPLFTPGYCISTEYEIQIALGRLERIVVGDAVPPRGKVEHLRGLLHLQRNDPKTALEHFNMALKHDSELAIAYWDRARAWQALGKGEQAKRDREKALSIDPSLKR